MDKDYLVKITLAVYQTSEEWKEGDFLKFKLRNLANEILGDFILFWHENPSQNLRSKILQEIQEIQEGFGQARAKKLLDRDGFLLFQTEYNNIERRFGDLTPPKRAKGTRKQEDFSKRAFVKKELSERQRKILEILTQKDRSQVQDFQKFFLETSKRTLRRDLEDLLKKGLVERGGKWNLVFYTLPKGGRTES